MKKLFSIIAVFVLMLTSGVLLSACGGKEFTATAKLTTRAEQHVDNVSLKSKSIHTPSGGTPLFIQDWNTDPIVFYFPENYEASTGMSSSVTGTEITIEIGFSYGWDPTGMVVKDGDETLEVTVNNENKFVKVLIAKITKSGERDLTLEGVPTPIVASVMLENIWLSEENQLDINGQNFLENIQIRARKVGTDDEQDWIKLKMLSNNNVRFETIIDFSVDGTTFYLKLPQNYAKNSLSMMLVNGERFMYNEYFSDPSQGIYGYGYNLIELGRMETPTFKFNFDRFRNASNY